MPITKREAAIISAYSGIMLGKWEDCHKYIEEIMGRPVYTHELPILIFEIQEKAKPDFMKLEVDDGDFI